MRVHVSESVGLPTSLFLSMLFVTNSVISQDSSLARGSARSSEEYMKRVMDEFHNRVPVYDDVSSPGNRFHVYAKIPDGAAPVDMNGSFVTASSAMHQTGATVIRCEFWNDGIHPFAGFYFQNGLLPAGYTTPIPNFGTTPNAGINLSGAKSFSFWVKGKSGGEKIDFFIGGVGRDAATGFATSPYPDSSPRYPGFGPFGPVPFVLDTSWQKITFNLNFLNLTYVLGGFGWTATASDNPNGAVFYLDKIQYELKDQDLAIRLNQPRFLRSFTTLALQPDPNDGNLNDDIDLVLRNLAFSYDNALALLAFLADSTPDNLRRARLIGDAFLYAQAHDRTFNDGRIRDAYTAGDIELPEGWTPNNRQGTVPIPGFYNEAQHTFIEVEAANISVGNNAWVLISLLALYKRTSDIVYLSAARKIGQFIEGFRNNTGRYRGYQGGLENIETPNPTRRTWASVEHNLDIYVGYTMMNRLTGESQWLAGAQHAKEFVDSMWRTQNSCYVTGTIDPNTLNTTPGQLPLDPQSWSSIASPDINPVFHIPISCAEQNHKSSDLGFNGFDFNSDKDGVWFEGTGQMAVAYAFANMQQKAYDLRVQLRKAQVTIPFGDSLGIAAASHDLLTTGFGFYYFRRLHVAATSWNVFAQLQFNPYYQNYVDLLTLLFGGGNIPGDMFLKNYPNPFNNSTSIVYSIPRADHVTIKIYNISGQELATLLNESRPPGADIIRWNGQSRYGVPLSNGLYIVQMKAGNSAISRKMLLKR